MTTISNRESQPKSLSTRESPALSRLARRNRQVINISDLMDVLDIPRRPARDMAYSLKEKSWLEWGAQADVAAEVTHKIWTEALTEPLQ